MLPTTQTAQAICGLYLLHHSALMHFLFPKIIRRNLKALYKLRSEEKEEEEEATAMGKKAKSLLLGIENLSDIVSDNQHRQGDFDLGDWFDQHTQRCIAQTKEKDSFALMENMTAFGLEDDAIESLIEQIINIDAASMGNTLPWSRRDARRLLQGAQ